MMYFFICYLGAIFGSFYYVVGIRIPIDKKFYYGRSVCPHCNHQLTWLELIPVFSYVIQGGKCRTCKRTISIQYPVFEFITALLFLLCYIHFGFSIEIITSFFLVSMLVILLVTDINYMLIPDKILLFFLPIFITMRFIQPLEPWWSPIAGAILGFIMIAVVILISHGGMGAGDMKLFAVLGIVLGMKNLFITFFLSCMIGACIGLILLATKAINQKQPIPFGPFIVIATMITYFYGESLLYWYMNWIL